jgi:hypothetical protein
MFYHLGGAPDGIEAAQETTPLHPHKVEFVIVDAVTLHLGLLEVVSNLMVIHHCF